MAYNSIPTRTSADTNSSADINTIQTNTDFMRGAMTAISLDGATNIDLSTDSTFHCELDANAVVTFTNIEVGQSGFIQVDQDASSVYTLSAAGTVYGDTLAEPASTSDVDIWSYVVMEQFDTTTAVVCLAKKTAVQ